jgi:hypothetical protein
MTENQQPPIQNSTKELLEDFETAVAEKNKIITKERSEKEAAVRARMRLETELDNERIAKQSALDRAERAEARYLRNTELKAKSQAQEKNLLNTLFGGNN